MQAQKAEFSTHPESGSEQDMFFLVRNVFRRKACLLGIAAALALMGIAASLRS
jgi:LPS O-antigen subunit length determinant protein (WzzB/FepE family)